MDPLPRRALIALAFSLAAGCASEPSACQNDSDCGSGQLCIAGSCEGEGLSLNNRSPIGVVPPTDDRGATAGVKPGDAQFSVVDSSIIPHFFSVSCDSGAVPSPRNGFAYLHGNASVTVSLQPPPPGDSTVTCRVASLSGATLWGTYKLTLHAGGGVNPGDFTVSAAPASLEVGDGASGTSALTVAPVSGFESDVALSVSGVPSGVTATLSSATVAGGNGTSTLTVANASAAAGSYTLQIAATGGGLTHSTSIALTIPQPPPPPDFTVSANPAAIAVSQGGSGGSSRITVAPANGFGSSVSLSVSGVPSGATASFDSATIAGGSGSALLTVAAQTAAPGTSTLTVTASGGGLSHATAISLTVSAAAAVCGNGIREAGEQCDDGNTENLDGCDETCHFEQEQRADAVTMQFGTSATCAANALGGAIASAAQSQFQTSVTTSVANGSLTMAFKFMGLADLTGAGSQSFRLGALTGSPYAAPSGETYNGASDLDWWYATSSADYDGNRDPTQALDATLSGNKLSAGPGSMSLTLAFGGGPVALAASNVRIGATIGSSSAPTEASATPGHLPGEHLDPSLKSFASMSGGSFCGNLSALSMSKAMVPSALLSQAACQGITTSNSLLDLMVAGCKISVIGLPVTVITATQPDQVDAGAAPAGAGGPYKLSLGSGSRVTGCADKGGAAVNLAQCLAAAAYSSYLTFTSDRVIMK
ncbi:MAG TPA: hypothetical protein VLW85_13230 [Myxococcales bacterium]|nr:hypothetical protein [Myxococcales bacterium]